MQSANEPVVIQPGEGERTWLLGDTYTVKLTGDQTGGAFSLLEALVPPGGGPPPHAHLAEDETFIILEGEIAFSMASGTVNAAAGAVVHVPRGAIHSYATVGDAPVRMLFLYAPSGMEAMFGEIGTPARPGKPAPPFSLEDAAKLASVATKYRFTILPPPPAE